MVNLTVLRKRLEMQGYLGWSDAQLREVGPWTKLAPGLCMTWVAVGTILQSSTLIWALVPLAALGAALPRHPFDLLYNHGIRHLTKTAALPRHGVPRRFACSIATVWLCGIAWAFSVGKVGLGSILGWSMVAAAASPTLIDFCIPSFIYSVLTGKPASCRL